MKQTIWMATVLIGMIIGLTACAQNKQTIKPDQIQKMVTVTPTLTVVFTPTPISENIMMPTPTAVPIVKKKSQPFDKTGHINYQKSEEKNVMNSALTMSDSGADNEDNDFDGESMGQLVETVRAEPTEVERINQFGYEASNVIVGDMVWTPTPIAVVSYNENKQAGNVPTKKSYFLPILLILLAIISFGILIMRNRKKQVMEKPIESPEVDSKRFSDALIDSEKVQATTQSRQHQESVEKTHDQPEDEEQIREAVTLKEVKEDRAGHDNHPKEVRAVGGGHDSLENVSIGQDTKKSKGVENKVVPKVSLRSTVKKAVRKPLKKTKKKIAKKVVKKAASKITKKVVGNQNKKVVKKTKKKVVKTVTKKTVTKKIVKKVAKKTARKIA